MARSVPLYERHPFPATERDLDDLPEDVTGEILDGELIIRPRPGPPHTQAASGLGFLLGPAFQHGFGGRSSVPDEPPAQSSSTPFAAIHSLLSFER
jgi:hypothetical protein